MTTDLSPGPKSYTRRGGFLHFMRLRNQLVIAAKNLDRVENLSPVLIQTMSKDMDEQLKLAHKVVDVVDRPYRKICITVSRYNVHKLQSAYCQVRLFARKKEDEKFQQTVFVNYKHEEFSCLLDVVSSVMTKLLLLIPFVVSYKK